MNSNRGVKSSNQGSVTYWSASYGKLARRVSEDTPGAKARTITKGPNEGKVVYELFEDSIEGELLKVSLEDKDSKYGAQWYFYFDCSTNPVEEDMHVVRMPHTARYAESILKAIPNIDATIDTALVGYDFTPRGEDKRKVGFTLKQRGAGNQGDLQKVEWYYTNENSNGLPPLDQVVLKGQTHYDSTKRLEFLENMVNQLFSDGTIQEQNTPEANEEVPF